MQIMCDIELSFTMEEMKMISSAADLHKQTPQEYVAQAITKTYTKDLKKNDTRKSNKRTN